jgi:hypothetical protein
MARKEQTPDQCDNFTGCFVGRCGAGIPYEDVKHQDRRGQMARYPCLQSLDAFTTCDRARFTPRRRVRRRIALSRKNVGREVIFEQETEAGTEKLLGILTGWSGDGAKVFISYRPKKRSQVVSMPIEKCYLARKTAATFAPGSGELPLFDLREVRPTGRREAREEVTDKAA